MIDLHTHTKFSDGEYTPEKCIDLAISKDINALAITDHDTADGLEMAEEYAKNKNILLIPGIELEADVPKGQMHILGLFIDYKNAYFMKELEEIKNTRRSRNEKFIEELNRRGFEVTLEELKEVSSGNTIGKPHFAKVFLQKGYIQNKQEMFDRFFNQPPLKQLKKSTKTPRQIIELIKRANGMAVLAHPQFLKLNDEELVAKVRELKWYGLDGMECYHSKQTIEEMNKYNKIAKDLNLVITKGTDFHGPNVKPETELGTGNNNNLKIGEEQEEAILHNVLQYVERIKSKNEISFNDYR